MSRKNTQIARVQTNALTAEEAEALFRTVDETGHTNEESAARQRRHRKDTGAGVDVDPLAGEDPSGSNIGRTIATAATAFVVVMFVAVIGMQVFYGYLRRVNTANLSEDVSVRNVASALSGGVEWGNGFTQFPENFSVQEADENTGRIEVTVTDTSSETMLEVIAGSSVQASALAVNSLLNPNINTVIYHVYAYTDDAGDIQTPALFGFLPPSGSETPVITFVWTKTVSATGDVHFNCQISGLDDEMQEALREQITSSFTPTSIFGSSTSDDEASDDEAAEDETSEEDATEGAESDEDAAAAESTDAQAEADADSAESAEQASE